jgi:glucose-1-phosphate adenylyltransferase
VARTEAAVFGVVQAAADGRRIESFLEKPAGLPARPGHPDEVFASMGVYVFDREVLAEALKKDAADDGSRRSIGGDIIPRLVRERSAYMYDFRQNEVPGADARDQGYWRDLRTIDSYFGAHMDLCAVQPEFNLYNDRWPILSQMSLQPPAKFVHDDGDRAGRAVNSVVSNGVIVSGGLVSNSVLSPGARVDSWSRVDRAVILHNSRVHRHAVVENAILDKNVVVLEGAAVGVDKDRDRARGLVVSDGGVTVVGKGQVVAP